MACWPAGNCLPRQILRYFELAPLAQKNKEISKNYALNNTTTVPLSLNQIVPLTKGGNRGLSIFFEWELFTTPSPPFLRGTFFSYHPETRTNKMNISLYLQNDKLLSFFVTVQRKKEKNQLFSWQGFSVEFVIFGFEASWCIFLW